MSEIQGGVDTPNGEPEAQTSDTPTVEELQAQLKAAQDKIAEVNREAKKRRLDKEAADAKAKEDLEVKMTEQQEFKKLADTLAKERDELKPLADKATRFEEALLATLTKRLDALPDMWRSVVPDFGDPVKTMEWIDANADKFQTPKFPNIDAGAGNTPSPKGAPKLTALEMEIAKSFNMSPEEYVKFREKGNAVKQTPDK